MGYILPSSTAVVRLKLARDRTKAIKQGFPWIYRDWLAECPEAPLGARALVRDRDGKLLAFGYYDCSSSLAVRVCAVESEQLDDVLIEDRLTEAIARRVVIASPQTTGYRLLNGEGDGLPGLVVDRYDNWAVLKLDGPAAEQFWNTSAIAERLQKIIGLEGIYQRFRSQEAQRGRALIADPPKEPVSFLEHGLRFEADLIHGQKTGFFFDQRENRLRVKGWSIGRTVLNLFGYTGGFSVYAGAGNASEVTTVDLAKPAVATAHRNWLANNFDTTRHHSVARDAFEFLSESLSSGKTWQLVIVDPPAFASSPRHLAQAQESYQRLFSLALQVLSADGLIALSSCSAHVSMTDFMEIVRRAFSQAKRRGRVLGVYGQPEDHPFPLVCSDLQYLKFVLVATK